MNDLGLQSPPEQPAPPVQNDPGSNVAKYEQLMQAKTRLGAVRR